MARVGDDETTALVTIVTYADQPAARLVVSAGDDVPPHTIDIPVADIPPISRRAPPQAAARCFGWRSVRPARC